MKETISEDEVREMVEDIVAVFRWVDIRCSVVLDRLVWLYAHDNQVRETELSLWFGDDIRREYKFPSWTDLEKFRNWLEGAENRGEKYRSDREMLKREEVKDVRGSG